MNSLKGKLIFTYATISLLIVLSLSVLFNISMDMFFKQYAIRQQQKQINNVISQVSQQYIERSGLYYLDGLEVIANAALQNGIIVHVQTINNEIDWDIRQHKARECQVLLQHAETNMHSRYPNFQGGYMEETYDLRNNNKLTGYLTIGFYGPYSLGDNELALISILNKTLAALGAFFLTGAILLGIVMARGIAMPITSVIHTSKMIAHGDYGIKAGESPTTQEISELVDSINEMSQALATKEQQKKQLTADVAHELRTPLFNLQGNMEAMIDRVLDPTTERLCNCHAEIIRMTRIVEQLQELNLLESDRGFITKESFDFTMLCESLFSDFESVARSKDIRLQKTVPTPAPVFGDLYRIKQCMMNLISNSIEHSTEHGVVTVEYQETWDHVILRVRDNGSGIPSQDLPHVFERFYRVDKSRNKKTGGIGIGLSITKAIVDAHNGIITVDSKTGEGTVFTITLPL